jgi:AraC-like DNA-binding protein
MYHGQVILRKSLHYQDTLFINHANNNFSLKYTSFYYPDPEHISYLYKLEGYQDEWKKLVHPYNMASFSNLPQGEYTLKLKLVTPHGKKSKITDEKTIIIFPPWYKTLWFKFLLVLLLVGTVFLINFIRTFQIRQRNRLLENLVKERTHEIEKEKEEIQQNFNQLALMNSESRENRIQASKTKNTDQEILEKMDLKLEGLSSEDHKFIMKLVKLISENLSDPELNINELASRMAMSRATLHNYIKRTTGKSASEFVRLYKIVSGATFLKKGYSISETLYFIGINSRSYFNKCFKEMYGQTPSQFIKNL